MGNDIGTLGKALSCDLKDQLEEDEPEKVTKYRVQRSLEKPGKYGGWKHTGGCCMQVESVATRNALFTLEVFDDIDKNHFNE